MSVPCLVIVVDDSPLLYLVDDVVHELVDAGEPVALLGVDEPAATYSRSFGDEMALSDDDEADRVIGLVSTRSLARLVAGDKDPGIDLLRTALADGAPTLLAVSEDASAQVDAAQWTEIARFLASTSAWWLSLTDGSISAASEASRPPADFDPLLHVDPPRWADPWSWPRPAAG
jgi:hypothetical protein